MRVSWDGPSSYRPMSVKKNLITSNFSHCLVYSSSYRDRGGDCRYLLVNLDWTQAEIRSLESQSFYSFLCRFEGGAQVAK